MTKKKYTKIDIPKMIKFSKDGLEIMEAARALNICSTTLNKYAKKNGVTFVKGKSGVKKKSK